MTTKKIDINFTTLVFEGKVSEDDLLYIRDNMGKTLQELDLSKASFEGNELTGDVFADCNGLTTITFPNTVIEIDLLSLKSCNNLATISVEPGNPVLASENGVLFNDIKSLLIFYPNARKDDKGYIIPDTVTRIETFAFFGCRYLTSVFIPASVTEIAYHVFNGCSNLTEITVHPDNPVYASENGVLFNKDKTQLIYTPEGLKGDCFIPNNFKEISEYFIETLFRQHEFSKTAVKKDNGQDNRIFENYEVKNKHYHTAEEIKESLRKKMPLDTKIKLTPELRLEQALKEAKPEDISRLRKLTVVGTMTASDIEYINSNINETLQELNISDASLEGNKIISGALKNCKKLTCVSLSATVTEIADDAFSGCVTTITVQPGNPVYKSKNGKLI